MAIQYGSKFVDEKYSDILEPNLYGDSVLQPGISFTDKYMMGAAGQIFVHKPGSAGAISPQAPAQDFTDVDVADTLIAIAMNNTFQRSRKIYGVQAAAVEYSMAESELSEAVKEVTEGWQTSGLAALAFEGTDYGDITAVTSSNVKDYFIALRKALRDNKATATTAIVSTAFYEAILQYTGNDFNPVKNDSVVMSGRAGEWYGITVIESNLLGNAAAQYIDYTTTTQTVNLTTVDIIMYDYDAFSILTNFEVARLQDSERFAGSLAQVEVNSGFRVTNADRVVVKFNA